jgi:hypothetical protein
VIKTLNWALFVACVVALCSAAWRLNSDARAKQAAMNALSRSFEPTAPTWCYPEDGRPYPTDPDERLRHLKACYPEIDRMEKGATP